MKLLFCFLLVSIMSTSFGCGFFGESGFDKALKYNKDAGLSSQQNFVAITKVAINRDNLTFKALQGNQAATAIYSCLTNIRDLELAKIFRPSPMRTPLTNGELAVKLIPDLAGTVVTGVLGWKGLDTLGTLFDKVGSNYYFDSAGNMQVQDIGNSWDVSTVGDGNFFSKSGGSFDGNGGEIPEIEELTPE